VDVKKEAAKLPEMLKFSGGKRVVPVIVKAGKATVGFGGT
jgi:glutaredoxin